MHPSIHQTEALVTTLTPSEMIPDDLARRMIADHHTRENGRLSDIDTSCMVMLLPDLCSQLAALRAELRALGRAPRESVSDAVLRRLARDTPERASGQLADTDHIILSARLRSMCVELLEARNLLRRVAA